MSSEQTGKQQPTQNTEQPPANQNGDQQQSGRDQSVDQRLIYQVQKAYEPIERQIQEGTDNSQRPTIEKQSLREEAPKPPQKPNADDKQKE